MRLQSKYSTGQRDRAIAPVGPSVTAKYGWESVGVALLLALGLVGGLILVQVLNRWLIRQMTRSGSEPEESNGPQEC